MHPLAGGSPCSCKEILSWTEVCGPVISMPFVVKSVSFQETSRICWPDSSMPSQWSWTSTVRVLARPRGSVRKSGRGLAVDQCYYFEAGKPAAVAAARARKSNDVADYPNPDLAIEVDLSPPEIDRAGIYAALKVVFVGIGGQSPLLQRGDASARGFVGAGSVRRSQAAPSC